MPSSSCHAKLVLLRHAQSLWNLENRFTGWADIDLSEAGIREARAAGQLLYKHGFKFDEAYTSVLKRAVRTLWIVEDELDQLWLPVQKTWRLNERHYGALEGLDKQEIASRYGHEQFHVWRRSYATPPPALDRDDTRHPSRDRRYADMDAALLPATESLEDTFRRVLPYWQNVIAPRVAQGKAVLISSHGNTLRALVKHFDQISDKAVETLEIPTGRPLIYEFAADASVIEHYYLEHVAVSNSYEDIAS